VSPGAHLDVGPLIFSGWRQGYYKTSSTAQDSCTTKNQPVQSTLSAEAESMRTGCEQSHALIFCKITSTTKELHLKTPVPLLPSSGPLAWEGLSSSDVLFS
jgi:hypothetical protein